MKRLLTIILVCVAMNVVVATTALGQAFNFRHLTTREGLADNYVYCMAEDEYGYVWIATGQGLCSFDGYDLRHYDLWATGNNLYNLWVDKTNTPWVKAGDAYYYYDRNLDRISSASDALEKEVNGQSLQFLCVDKAGDVWYSCDGKRLFLRDDGTDGQRSWLMPEGQQVQSLVCNERDVYVLSADGSLLRADKQRGAELQHLGNLPADADHIRRICLDSHGNLWTFCLQDEQPLQLWQPVSNSLLTLRDDAGRTFCHVNDVCDDGMGNLWIASNDGTYVYHTADGTSTPVRDASNRWASELRHVGCLMLDRQDVMWVGSTKTGVAYTNLHETTVEDITKEGMDDVSCMVEDHRGDLWVGVDGGGLFHLSASGQVLAHLTEENGQLPSDNLVCGLCDQQGRLWFGTFGGGVFCVENGRVKPVTYNGRRSDNPIAAVKCLAEDGDGNIWIGTIVEGLYCRKPDGHFEDFTVEFTPIGSNCICDLLCLPDGQLCVSTTEGAFVMDVRSHAVTPLPRSEKEHQRLHAATDRYVNALLADSRGLLWMGTRAGIVVYDERTDKGHLLTEADGLKGQFVRGLAEDNQHHVWVTTDIGITKVEVTPARGNAMPALRCLTQEDGSHEGHILFGNHSICRLAHGTMLIGGLGGLLELSPTPSSSTAEAHTVRFTSLSVNGQKVRPGEKLDGHLILSQGMEATERLCLSYGHRNIQLTVSAFDYQHPGKTRFVFRQTRDGEWSPLTGNTITFNDLAPGNYTIQVKAYSARGETLPTTLHLRICPPLWLSGWAIAGYILLALAAIALLLARWRRRTRLRMEREKREFELDKQHELDETRMRFFTNISHDLRTPLSLIVSPLQRLLSRDIPDAAMRRDLELMERNSRVVMNEVNQLLDLRRLVGSDFSLRLSHGDLTALVSEVFESVQQLQESRQLHFSLVMENQPISMNMDRDKVSRVLINLLTNAIKYNADDGSVTVTVSQHAEQAVITVADTGIGINDEAKPHIFERFYQGHHTPHITGNGIGLHIAKEFVQLHKGTISVADNHPRGTVFTVTLPTDLPLPLEETATVPSEAETVLVVEDNDDFRQFVADCLKPHYAVLCAADGQQALQVLKSHAVSLVITDVMMPVMDGLQLCNHIKGDINLSHIPVIMLTAKTADEHRLEGLREGADDYIAKPFNLDILLLRVQKLLAWRAQSHQRFQTAVEVEPSEITISSLDEQLVARAIQIVESHISDSDFGVEQLSQEVGMTRGHLYKKLMAITGKSPLDFIRTLRLKRARQYLEKSQLGVAEIAWKVGISPRQFTKYFKEAYGMTPSEFQNGQGA